MGEFVCALFEQDAPNTVKNFIELAEGKRQWTHPATRKPTNEPLYNGTIFHRVIPDFMIQGGDPLGSGIGGPGYKFADEPNAHRFTKPGILAMANSGKDTNGSQFFVTVVPTPWLNGLHTIFGEVIEGYPAVEEISKVKGDRNNKPLTPVTLLQMSIQRVQ
jgi:peptidyl-prolyl cis-trans isomerase A (cyclophilin A)